MKFHSTKNPNQLVNLETAIFNSLPQDNGLYVPQYIPQLDKDFIANIHKYSLAEIAYKVSHALLGDDISSHDLEQIISNSITFDAPLKLIEPGIYALELFHGPSLAFKDFGARFMAQIMGYYIKKSNRPKLNILVATSGDTGSAVAQGFLGVDNINVYILYPSNKISLIQEKQLTTLGQNITALEVNGTFDDCQRLVKQAFLDQELCAQMNLSSANSINISRLIPQSFYYFYGYANLEPGKKAVFSVPSGNFGNLCAGILAKKMGLPIDHFIAATNVNDVVVKYLHDSEYEPRASQSTIANAMDVGNPSNFVRLSYLYNGDVNQIRKDLSGYSYNDNEIKKIIKTVDIKKGYLLDPHGAIGYMALKQYISENNYPIDGVFLETAHPAKFSDVIEPVIGREVILPKSLKEIVVKPKHSIKLEADYLALKNLIYVKK